MATHPLVTLHTRPSHPHSKQHPGTQLRLYAHLGVLSQPQQNLPPGLPHLHGPTRHSGSLVYPKCDHFSNCIPPPSLQSANMPGKGPPGPHPAWRHPPDAGSLSCDHPEAQPETGRDGKVRKNGCENVLLRRLLQLKSHLLNFSVTIRLSVKQLILLTAQMATLKTENPRMMSIIIRVPSRAMHLAACSERPFH